MTIVDTDVGALLIGGSANLVLYGIELVQMWHYFTTYTNDPILLKIMVVAALCSDTLGSTSNVICVYSYAITNFGNLPALSVQGWEIPSYLITTGLSALFAQSYLAWRFTRLCRKYYIGAVIGLCITVALVFAFWTAHGIITATSLAERTTVVTVVTVWLTMEAATDVFIALSLIIYLLKYSDSDILSTKKLIRGLIFLAAESGTLTTICALVILALFLKWPDNNVCVGVAFTLGRMYTMTLLLNLNIRKSTLGGSDEIGSMVGSPSGAFKLSTMNNTRRNAAIGMQSINVNTEVKVAIDGPDEPMTVVTFEKGDYDYESQNSR